MHNTSFKNIIFDLGGVILDIDYDRTIQAFKNLGIQDFEQLYTQAAQTGFFDDFETGKMSSAAFITALQHKIENDISNAEIIHAWNAMLLDWDMRRLNLLLELRKHHRVFLLSNTNSLHQSAFMKSLKQQTGLDTLSNHFDKVYMSHEIGLRKPNLDVFEFVLNDQQMNAEETLFLDDSIQHVEGAKKLGITTHGITKSGEILQLFS
jgi:putative hydrolase of the HAD superfamily